MPSKTRSRTTHQGLFAPKPLRRNCLVGRAIIKLEIPDCGCRRPRKRCGCQGPCDCPEQSLQDQFWPLCPHLLALDPDEFPLSPEEWLTLLLGYDWDGYRDP